MQVRSNGGNKNESAFIFIRSRRESLLFVEIAVESSNGRTTVSGTVYLGSSPGSTA